MKKPQNSGIDIEIDELTNSIKNVISGDSFSTDIIRITNVDLKTITKRNGWQFDWKFGLNRQK